MNRRNIFSCGLKIGDRVSILNKEIYGFKHRKSLNGRVVGVNGAYIDVQPMWSKRILECYPNELKRL